MDLADDSQIYTVSSKENEIKQNVLKDERNNQYMYNFL